MPFCRHGAALFAVAEDLMTEHNDIQRTNRGMMSSSEAGAIPPRVVLFVCMYPMI